MSQAGLVDIETAHPEIPTQFDTDDGGNAVPVGNVLEMFSNTVANATYAEPLWTTGSGNTVTTNIQVGAAITGAPADKNDAGLVSFDDTQFTVSTHGFVQLSSIPLDSMAGDDGVSVSPDGTGLLTLLGNVTSNATHAKPVYVKDSATANALDIDVQVATAIAADAGDSNDAGLCSFDSTSFTVSATGFVQLVGSGPIVDTFTTDINGPVSPDGSGNVNITTGQVFSDGAVANTVKLSVAATANTFLYGQGSNLAMSELGPLTNGQLIIGSTGAAPVAGSLTQPAAGLTIGGGAGTITFALADDLAALEALAATGVASRTGASTWQTSAVTENAVVIGGASESLAMLTLTNGQLVIGSTGAVPVAATPTSSDGSITITGGAGTLDLVVAAADDAILTLTGDTGGALSPTAGNINILGGPGVTVTGSGSTLTVNAVVYTDQTATTLTSDSGTFATAAGAYTLPASPTIGEIVEIVCITSGIVVTANTGQEIQIGGDVTSTAGTATNSAKGDALVLRYRDTDTAWYAISVVGVWSLA